MKFINNIKCFFKGHKSAMTKLFVPQFIVIGTSGLPIANLKLCSRCKAMYWEVPQNIPKKYHNDIEGYDDAKRKELKTSPIYPITGNA